MASSEENLKKLLETIAIEQNYSPAKITVKGINSGGANYMTALYLATISEPPKPDLNIFAKVAKLSRKIREKNQILAKAFEIESTFYTQLAVHFEKLYEKNNVAAEHRLMIPKFYGQLLNEMEETMVLENLEAKGYQSFNRMKTFDWEYAATAVQQLARFHALGLALRDDNPSEFKRIMKVMQIDMVADAGARSAYYDKALQNGCSAASKEYTDRLQKYIESGILKEAVASVVADNTMLIHRDFRPSNLMHRRKNGKLEIIPLDFQILQLGNPVADLMYFIFTGSDEEFRQLHYERFLDHYHSELTIALRHLQLDVNNVYPKKTFELDLLDYRPLGLFYGLLIVAVVTVNPKDAPKKEADMEEMSVKVNSLGQERINGIIKDYVRWGVL